MINRFNGFCSLCLKPLPKGSEVHYDGESKTIQHWECVSDIKPTADQYALAERLGYREVSWEQLLLVLNAAADDSERQPPDSRERDTLRPVPEEGEA